MKNSPWIQMDFRLWCSVCLPQYVIELPKQTYLFHQGYLVDFVFIVKEGRILVSSFSQDGAEKILMFIADGGIIGEQNLYFSEKTSYSARTVTGSVLYKIPKGFFMMMLKEDRGLADLVIQAQLKKESALISHIVELSFQDAYHRAIHELLFCANAYGESTPEGIIIKIPISQEGLGKRIQASRITVNKVLKRLSEEELVGRKGQYFVLLDIDVLEKIDCFG